MSKGGRLTLKIAAVFFVLLGGIALEAAGADGSSDLPMREVDAGEILSKIQNCQPVEYDHVVVRGDLDLSWDRLQKNITSPIRINDSNFNGEMSFNGTTLVEKIDLTGSNFNRDVSFRRVTFSNEAKFGEANFNGYVDFRGANFSNEANFGEANFNGYADFRGANFSNEANFGEANFSGNTNFVWTTFSGNAYFWKANFSRNANFESANFSGDAYFWEANFSGDAKFFGTKFFGANFNNIDFRWVNFSGNANFGEATFSNKANFEEANFSDYADFRGAIFSNEANFGDAIFSGYADFREKIFSGFANFGGANFRDNANFSWATFSNEANFGEAIFSGYADFREEIFSGFANFGGANFSGISSFEDAEFNGNTEFVGAKFNNETSFYRILFKRPAYFEDCHIKNLDLTKADFGRLYLRWDGIDDMHFDEAAYLALIKNYNSLGWYGDANDCYFAYRNAVRKNWQAASSPGFAARMSNLLDRLIDFGEWLLYGYGVRPSFPIAWSVGIILAFGLFFWQKSCLRKIMVEERIEDSRDASDEVQIKTIARKAEVNAIDPLLFSLFTFTSGFTAFLHPGIEYKLERCLRWAIAERLLGPFFLALVITTISKTYLIR